MVEMIYLRKIKNKCLIILINTENWRDLLINADINN